MLSVLLLATALFLAPCTLILQHEPPFCDEHRIEPGYSNCFEGPVLVDVEYPSIKIDLSWTHTDITEEDFCQLLSGTIELTYIIDDELIERDLEVLGEVVEGEGGTNQAYLIAIDDEGCIENITAQLRDSLDIMLQSDGECRFPRLSFPRRDCEES